MSELHVSGSTDEEDALINKKYLVIPPEWATGLICTCSS